MSKVEAIIDFVNLLERAPAANKIADEAAELLSRRGTSTNDTLARFVGSLSELQRASMERNVAQTLGAEATKTWDTTVMGLFDRTNVALNDLTAASVRMRGRARTRMEAFSDAGALGQAPAYAKYLQAHPLSQHQDLKEMGRASVMSAMLGEKLPRSLSDALKGIL